MDEADEVAACQREIFRLRKIVRAWNRIYDELKNPDYEKLFEAWVDVDDDESPAGAKTQGERLGPMDKMSFFGFCAGVSYAVKIFGEE